MTSRISNIAFASQIITLENKFKSLDPLSIAVSGKVCKLFRKLERIGLFRELRQERRLLPSRVFIHPRSKNAKEKISQIIYFMKKGVVLSTMFRRVEHDNQKEIFHQIWPLCRSVKSPEGLISLPIRLLSVQDSERTGVYKALRLISLEEHSYLDKLQLLDLLKTIDPKDREDIASIVHDLKEHFLSAKISTNVISKVISALKFLPLTIRQKIYEIPPEHIQLTENEFFLLQTILSSPREIESTKLFLMEKIHSTHDVNLAKHYVTPLLEHYESFMLSLDHPLFELAFTTKEYIDNLSNPKNPYTIFSRFQELEKSRLQIPNQIEEVQGIKCFINFKSLKNYSFSHFPKADLQARLGTVYSERHFTRLIEKMETRIRLQERNQKERIYEYVKTSLSDTYQNLRSNLKDPFFLSLFSTPKNTDFNVKEMSFQCILHYFSHLSVEESDLLTTQEENLLKFSESVKDCRTGKEEGLITFYQHLPTEYKFTLSSLNSLNPNILKAKTSVFSVMEEFLNDLTASASPFMLEITGFEKDIPQLAHHSQYVKNVLSTFFTFSHQLTFDFHTMILSDTLVSLRPIDIAQTFLRHCKVEALIDRLKINFLATDTSEGLYTAYSELLSASLSHQSAWNLEEETMSVTLSDKGALYLLLESGLIKHSH